MLQELFRLGAFLALFAVVAPQTLFLMQSAENGRDYGMILRDSPPNLEGWKLIPREPGYIIIEKQDEWGNRIRVYQSQ